MSIGDKIVSSIGAIPLSIRQDPVKGSPAIYDAIGSEIMGAGKGGSVLNQNYNFESGSVGWEVVDNTGTPVFSSIIDGIVGSNAVQGTGYEKLVLQSVDFISIDTARTYSISAWLRRISGISAGNVCYVGVRFYDANKTYVTQGWWAATAVVPSTTWTFYSATFGSGTGNTIPANTFYMSPVITLNLGNNGDIITAPFTIPNYTSDYAYQTQAVRLDEIPTADISASLKTAGDASVGAIKYNGLTQAAGQMDGGASVPSDTTRLNYDGDLYVTDVNATASVTANGGISDTPGAGTFRAPWFDLRTSATGTDALTIDTYNGAAFVPALEINATTQEVTANVSFSSPIVSTDSLHGGLVTAKGDVLAASGAGVLSNLSLGATGEVLTVDATQPLGVKWATPTGGTGGTVTGVTFPKSYITNGDFETDVSGWTNGTGITMTRDTGTILSGNASGLISKDAANRLSNYLYNAFTIETRHASSVLEITFDYQSGSGYTSAGLFQALIYDVTAATFIYPSVVDLPVGSGKFISKFATSTNTTYRLCFFVNTNSASAIAYDVDNVRVTEQSTYYGAAVSGWTAYTSTVSGGGSLSPTTVGLYYRRVGDSIQIQGVHTITVGGSGASIVNYTFPTGLTSGTAPSAIGSIENRTTNAIYALECGVAQSSFYAVTGASGLTGASYTASSYYILVSAPISQWSSNINLITDFTEYASNDGSGGTAAGTTYSTGMVYGMAGATVPSVASTTPSGYSTTRYKVSFNRPIQSTDRLTIEITDGTNWKPLEMCGGDVCTAELQNAGWYGLAITNIDTYSVYATFGNGGRLPGATYAANGQAWSAMSTYKWRIRKQSNGTMAEYSPTGAISNSTPYTPTFTALGTVTNINVTYQRVGTKLRASGSFTTGTVTASEARLSLPLGLTVNSSIVTVNSICGIVSRPAASTTYFGSYINMNAGMSYVTFGVASSTQAIPTNVNGNAVFSSSESVSFNFEVPISQWVTNLNVATDFTEYVYNTTSTSANDTTSFGYGQDGVLIPNTSLGTTTTKRVRFSSPIKSTDIIKIEAFDPSPGAWCDFIERLNAPLQLNATSYGPQLVQITSTDLDIQFANGGYTSYGATTYAANGTAWSALYTGGWKWRIRKISNGNMAEQVPVSLISGWNDYLPIVTGFGTSVPLFAKWRRVGTNMELNISFQSGTPTAVTANISLPSGYTVTGLVSSPVVGNAWRNNAGTNNRKRFTVVSSNDQTLLAFNSDDFATAASPMYVTGLLANVMIVAGEYIDLIASVQIAQWANNVNLATDFTEYASNSSSTDADDTTSFVTGSNGSIGVIGVTSLTASRSKRIQFSRPVQATDLLTIEIYDPSSGIWAPHTSNRPTGTFAFMQQNTIQYGIWLSPVGTGNSSQTNVGFGQYATANGATYGSAGTAWNAGLSGFRWRVRKTSSGNFAENNTVTSISTPTDANLNYITNGSFEASTSGWTGATGLTITRDTGVVLSGTGSGLISKDAANRSGSYVYYNVTTENRHQNVVLQISMDYKSGTGYTTPGMFQVAIYDVANSVYIYPVLPDLPTGQGKFVTKFVTSSSTQYRLQIMVNTTSTVAMQYWIDNVMITEEQTALATAISGWTAYTPTTNASAYLSSNTAQWRRVGNLMEVIGAYSFNATPGSADLDTGLPTGYTIDYSLLNLGGGESVAFVPGGGNWYDAGLYFSKEPHMAGVISGTYTKVGWRFENNAGTGWRNINVFVSGDKFSYYFSVPIAQWSVGTNLVSDYTEYAYNNDTSATASVLTSGFVNGSEGQSFSGSWAVGTTYTRRIQFNRPIQTTDIIQMEMMDTAATPQRWVPYTIKTPITISNTSVYGFSYTISGPNTIDAGFNAQGATAYSAATYGANGQAWSAYTAWKWRIRKISNGNTAEASPIINTPDFLPSYLKNPTFEKGQNIAYWNTYADTAQVLPVDGIGGAPIITFTANATTPLFGLVDGLLTKDAVNRQGNGFSTDFTIDSGAVGQAVNIQFSYKTSANYVSSDIGVYVYDVTNSILLYPADVNIPAATVATTFSTSFQPNSTSTSYRLIFQLRTVNATAYTLNIDNIQVGLQSKVNASAIGNWNSYTPSLTDSGGDQSNKFSTIQATWRRTGSTMNIKFVLGRNATAWSTNGSFQVGMPAGYTFDPLVFSTSLGPLGTAALSSTATNEIAIHVLTGSANNNFRFGKNNAADIGGTDLPVSTTYILADITVPIAQWSTNINLITDYTEYASNSSVTDADDSTSFAYGNSGSSAMFTFTAARTKRVRFTRPVQSTDLLFVEFYDSASDNWVSGSTLIIGASGQVIANVDTTSGVAISPYFSGMPKTDINIYFCRYRQSTNNWATGMTNLKWRVRKVSNGNMAEVPPTVVTPDFLPSYLKNGTFEKGMGTAYWTTYADVAGTLPVDGIGGSPTETFTANATIPLYGLGDAILTKDAANRQGNGVSTDFTIDAGAINQVLQVQFSYKTSANYALGDIGVYLYDTTNNILLFPADVNIPANLSAGVFSTTFYPNATSKTYRLILHTQTTNATAYTFEIDSVQVGIQDRVNATAIGGWTFFTPTITNIGTGTIVGAWRRIGDSMQMQVNVACTGAGTAATLVFNLPTGFTIDTSKLLAASGNGAQTIGTGTWFNNTLVYTQSTFFQSPGIGLYRTDALAALAGNNLANGHQLGINVTIPIAQWSSNINLITDYTEYASNSSAADADDSTSFAYGSAGSAIPGITASRYRYVRFSRPIQPTDILSIETQFSGGQWLDVSKGIAGNTLVYTTQNTASYGIAIYGNMDAYTVRIGFGAYAFTSSATYGGAGIAWGGYTSWRWRVRKISNGNTAEQAPTVITPDFLPSYLKNGTFEKGMGVAYWTTYADAAGVIPVDGIGGTANVTLLPNATTPLFGSWDAIFSKDATNRQGQGVSTDFTIDNGAIGQNLQIQFSYKTSANYVSGDLGVYILDTTNNILISPFDISVPKASASTIFTTTFYANTSTSYRFIFHVTSTNASAYTFEVDNIQVGIQPRINAAAVSGWTKYTPTTQGLGTISSDEVYWRRVGDSLELQGRFITGTCTSAEARIYLPTGYTTGVHSNSEIVGSWDRNFTTVSNVKSGSLLNPGAGTAYLNITSHDYSSSSSPFTAINGNAVWGNSEVESFHAVVPIAQWSSNVNLVTDFTEYAYNTSSATAAGDTTSFGYGKEGALIRGITASLSRRVRFTRVIQNSDKIYVEISPDQVEWFDASATYSDASSFTIMSFQTQNTTTYGLGRITKINTTDIDVAFGAYSEPSGATYGSAGNTWSGKGGNLYWRVRKVSNGNMAESVPPLGSLVEAGSNSNGYYRRYSDGTLICWIGSTNITLTMSTAYGNIFYGNASSYSMPYAFIDANYTISYETPNNGGGMPWLACSGLSSTSYGFRGIHPTSLTSFSFTFTMFAIGRWV
jgi:hypothetical protein